MYQLVNENPNPYLRLPEPILKAILDPIYEAGLEDFFKGLPESLVNKHKDRAFSVTQLQRSPRQVQLFVRHSKRVVLDAISQLHRLDGHMVHDLLRAYREPGDLTEQRIWIEFVFVDEHGEEHDFLLHGQYDRLSPKVARMQDYKRSKAISATFGSKFEHEAQLNIMRYMLSQEHGRFCPETGDTIFAEQPIDVELLENVFWYKDWDGRQAKPDDPSNLYPLGPIVTTPVEMWDDEKVEQYLIERLTLHYDGKHQDDEELPYCTEQERWKSNDLYKVFKIDPKTNKIQKTAKYKTESKLEAEDKKEELERTPDSKKETYPHKIVTLKGKSMRCAYCEIHDYCGQYKELQKELS